MPLNMPISVNNCNTDKTTGVPVNPKITDNKKNTSSLTDFESGNASFLLPNKQAMNNIAPTNNTPSTNTFGTLKKECNKYITNANKNIKIIQKNAIAKHRYLSKFLSNTAGKGLSIFTILKRSIGANFDGFLCTALGIRIKKLNMRTMNTIQYIENALTKGVVLILSI